MGKKIMLFTTAEGENICNKLLIVDRCLQLNKVQQLRNTSPKLFLLLLDGRIWFFSSLWYIYSLC